MTNTKTHSEENREATETQSFEGMDSIPDLSKVAIGREVQQIANSFDALNTSTNLKTHGATDGQSSPPTKEEVLTRVDSALQTLEAELKNGQSEGLKDYLKFLSSFHSYSFRNLMLIFMQNPDATMVAGFKAWKKLGRFVRKGEKGLRILAPVVRKKKAKESATEETKPKDDATEKLRKVVTGFRLVSVFDVSQTEGDELPSLGHYLGDPKENLDRLRSFIESKNIELRMENPGGGALGMSENGTIKVHPELDPADTFAVMVHEVAHELLHKGERRKETTPTVRETEAESVAYAVCSAVGLENHLRASDYIQLHQGDSGKFQQSLEIIRLTASEILEALKVES